MNKTSEMLFPRFDEAELLRTAPFICSEIADELVCVEGLKFFQSLSEIVGGDEVGELLAELIVVFIVKTLDCRILYGAMHDIGLGASIL